MQSFSCAWSSRPERAKPKHMASDGATPSCRSWVIDTGKYVLIISFRSAVRVDIERKRYKATRRDPRHVPQFEMFEEGSTALSSSTLQS